MKKIIIMGIMLVITVIQAKSQNNIDSVRLIRLKQNLLNDLNFLKMKLIPSKEWVYDTAISQKENDSLQKKWYSEEVRFSKQRSDRNSIIRSLAYDKRGYAFLNDYKEELIAELSVDTTNADALLVLSCLELTKSQKEKILHNPYATPLVRARLGDTKAEDSLLKKFNEFMAIKTSVPGDPLYVPLFINTPKSLDIFFRYMEQSDTAVSIESDFECIGKLKTSTSYQLYLCLFAMMRYYPAYNTFNPSYYKHYTKDGKLNIPNEDWKSICKKIEAQVFQLFKRRISIKAPYLYYFDCIVAGVEIDHYPTIEEYKEIYDSVNKNNR